MTPTGNSSAEVNNMADSLRKLVCCMLLLAIVGTVSAGYAVSENVGTGAPISISGGSGANSIFAAKCYFPIINLPAYYVCIMFCKIGGGGDSCAPTCEASLSVCE